MPIYCDYNATTPLDPRVLETMLPYLSGTYGNPSSIHRYGRLARTAIDVAREQVAALVNAHPTQIIFTGGGSESDNLAIKGVTANRKPGIIAVSSIEHDAVFKTAFSLMTSGWQVEQIPVDDQGRIKIQAFNPQTKLVSAMLANNETGVIQDVATIAENAKKVGAIVHTDAVQAVAKIPVDFNALNVDLMTITAHKIYGPQGVGALIWNRAIELTPLIHGGGHEQGLRSGTENLAGIVGFGKACEIAKAELMARSDKLKKLQMQFETGLSHLSGVVIFGQQASRVNNTTLLAMPGFDGEMLLMLLDKQGFAVSSGSACSSGTGQASHVVRAMNVPRDLAQCVIRVSFGQENTANDVEALLGVLSAIYNGRPLAENK